MRFAFWKTSGTPAPTLASLNYALGDIAGGGQSIIATGTNCAGVTAVNIWGSTVVPSATTGTTVTFTLPAHAAGATTVSLTSPGGTSGTLAFESWSPVQVTGVDAYLDANKGVTGGLAVNTWVDQSSNARSFTQSSGANKPAQTGIVFGALPSIRFTGGQTFVALATAINLQTTGVSIFAVAKWTDTTSTTPPPGNPGNCPLTIVGDRTNAYGSFGASAGAIRSNHYTGGVVLVDRGTTFNDGVARLIGATYDASTSVKVYVGTAQQGATDVSGALVGTTTYDTIGAGYPATDGWVGDIGAVVIVAGVISGGDLTKLNSWSQQRFGTP